LTDLLTTYDITQGNGVVEVNLAAALLSIAHAIERLASIQEKNAANAESRIERFEALMMSTGERGIRQ
jgi:hypothetical protein